MTSGNLTGVYGKLPAHGDFIYRDLPAPFIKTWDDWLQGYIGSGQELLGEQWLSLYRVSPIWRFVFSPGIIDEHCWAGFILPSADRVGRYFPFTVVTKLSATVNPCDFIVSCQAWYAAMEESALQALNGQLKIDDLMDELNDSRPMLKRPYSSVSALSSADQLVVQSVSSDSAAQSAMPFMMDAFLRSHLRAYSVWSTAGSQLVSPNMLVSRGLPAIATVPAFLDGDWQSWGWQEPYAVG